MAASELSLRIGKFSGAISANEGNITASAHRSDTHSTLTKAVAGVGIGALAGLAGLTFVASLAALVLMPPVGVGLLVGSAGLVALTAVSAYVAYKYFDCTFVGDFLKKIDDIQTEAREMDRAQREEANRRADIRTHNQVRQATEGSSALPRGRTNQHQARTITK